MKISIKKTDKIKAVGSHTIYPIMQRILKRQNQIAKQQEHFWSIGLDSEGIIEYIELLGIGSYKTVTVDTAAIFRMAIFKEVNSIIIVHSHPKGKLEPSEQDKEATEFVKHGGFFVNIPLIDHLIINETNYFSFYDNKLLNLKLEHPYKSGKSAKGKRK